MGRSSIGSSQTDPSRIEPQLGKISEDDVESRSERNDCCDVLKEQDSGSNNASDADDFGPEAASRTFLNASAISGVANVLAREARCEEIHSAGVRGWIEQPDISLVHVQAGEPSLGGSLAQDSAGVSVPLNSGNWLVPEDEVGEQSAPCSGEQVEGSHVISPTAKLPATTYARRSC
jgi:hypothetical protein